MQNSWMSFCFFCSNGTLDTVYPPEVYQVELIDNEYPLDHYDLPVEDIQPTMDSPLENRLSDGTKDDSF